MHVSSPARRFKELPTAAIAGTEVPVATRFRARLLGLSHLDLERAGAGLLIPRCSAVHTFGMRFALDLFFVGPDGAALAVRLGVGPRRFVSVPGAAAVLELPAPCPHRAAIAPEEGGSTDGGRGLGDR